MIDSTVTWLRELVAFQSVSSHGNLDIAECVAARLSDVGARVELLPNRAGDKANVYATLGPDTDGGIVLSGHLDVVPVADQDWSTNPFELTAIGDRLHGRGSCDMKGFIAACLDLAPVFAEAATARPVHFAFTYDEEVGCLGGRALVESLAGRATRPSVALIGEPTGMGIVNGHKGCCEYSARFSGLAGHGSAPNQGVNAVEYAVRYVARLLALADELKHRAPETSPFDPPWTTINVGEVRGGVAHNVIPSTAEVDWEMRPVQADDAEFVKAHLANYVRDELLPAMRAVHADAGIEVKTIGEVVGLTPRGNNEAHAIVAELTGHDDAHTVPFSTEAGLFQQLGLSVVVCGPGHIAQAHKADEYLERDQLARCRDMLLALSETLRTSQ
ncbi:MAG: acetylornithine deacetylase [Pseudomonadota bacterium]